MKRNIDLTERHDFHVDNSYHSPLKPYRKLPFPTTFDNIIPFIKDKWGIEQGDKEERKAKKWEKEFGDYITCDCCGRRLFCYYQSTLCPRCNERFEKPQWFGH